MKSVATVFVPGEGQGDCRATSQSTAVCASTSPKGQAALFRAVSESQAASDGRTLSGNLALAFTANVDSDTLDLGASVPGAPRLSELVPLTITDACQVTTDPCYGAGVGGSTATPGEGPTQPGTAAGTGASGSATGGGSTPVAGSGGRAGSAGNGSPTAGASAGSNGDTSGAAPSDTGTRTTPPFPGASASANSTGPSDTAPSGAGASGTRPGKQEHPKTAASDAGHPGRHRNWR